MFTWILLPYLQFFYLCQSVSPSDSSDVQTFLCLCVGESFHWSTFSSPCFVSLFVCFDRFLNSFSSSIFLLCYHYIVLHCVLILLLLSDICFNSFSIEMRVSVLSISVIFFLVFINKFLCWLCSLCSMFFLLFLVLLTVFSILLFISL